jgi:hypothetical protein
MPNNKFIEQYASIYINNVDLLDYPYIIFSYYLDMIANVNTFFLKSNQN